MRVSSEGRPLIIIGIIGKDARSAEPHHPIPSAINRVNGSIRQWSQRCEGAAFHVHPDYPLRAGNIQHRSPATPRRIPASHRGVDTPRRAIEVSQTLILKPTRGPNPHHGAASSGGNKNDRATLAQRTTPCRCNKRVFDGQPAGPDAISSRRGVTRFDTRRFC